MGAGFWGLAPVLSSGVPNQPRSSTARRERFHAAFAGCVGVFLALVLLKLGNPVILDDRIARPKQFLSVVTDAWPVAWGYLLVVLLAAASFLVLRFKSSAPRWVLWLPLVWLSWQIVASFQTVDARLSTVVLKHFFALAACFYVGHLALGRVKHLGAMWAVLLAAFVLMLGAGFRQHYLGLSQTLAYLEANEQTHWHDVPQDQLDDFVRQARKSLVASESRQGHVDDASFCVRCILNPACAGIDTPLVRGKISQALIL